MFSRCVAILIGAWLPMLAGILPLGPTHTANAIVAGTLATLFSLASLSDNRFRVATAVVGGWVALAPQQGAGPAPAPIARAPQAERAKQPAQLPLTSAAQDYLIAHQAYSPRNSLQGMAPYVRSVSVQVPARKP